MKKICITILFIVFWQLLSGQCDCDDCPITVPNNGNASSFMSISGASNPTLDANGQQVCQICLELLSDAIPEFNATIIAPDGSSITLILDTGIGVGQNIGFNICFLSCDQSASPDNGFPDVFDSNAGYVQNSFYDGTYYPSDGNCLEDLTGPVDGTWELEMGDVFSFDNTVLQGWTIGFTDDTGLNCSNPGSCSTPPPSCIAEGGELNIGSLILCEGDSGLDFSDPPSFPNGNEPPSSDYDYTYIITDAVTGVVIDINMTTDLTSYAPGEYQVCGLSYLIADASALPSPDGSLTLSDIQSEIDDEDYCADISDECIDIEITAPLPDPILDGPSVVCVDELVQYEITNYDPSLTYAISFTGGTSTFFVDDETINIAWFTGPAEICVGIDPSCGAPPVCLMVEITSATDLEILGELEPCPGTTEIYTFLPVPTSSQTYVINITGGSFTTLSNNSIEVIWDSTPMMGEICIELIDSGGGCVGDPICEDINIALDYEIPNDLNSPDEFCLGDEETSDVPDDGSVTNYIWTTTNLTITSGQGTNEVSYVADGSGVATICLEITTDCGSMQGPVCEDIDVFEYPDPMIIQVPPTCDFDFVIDATVSSNTDLEWDLIGGPGTISFSPDDGVPTMASVTQAGLYTIALIEDNNGCEVIDQITVEVLDGLMLSDPEFTCNLNDQYTVSFEILSGTSPFTVDGDLLGGSIFTSSEIESGEAFDFIVSDDLGCTFNLTGDFTCPCLTDAGSMPEEVLVACFVEGTGITAFWNMDGVLDNTDVGLYYLHDGDENNFGNIIDFNDTGDFEFLASQMQVNTFYYISFVVGNDDGGAPDFADPCLSISNGQPIIFRLFDELELNYPQFTCDNNLVIAGDLIGDLTFINWLQLDGPGLLSFDPNQNVPTTVTVSESGTYLIEYTYGNDFCAETYEFEIIFEKGPLIQNLTEDCNLNNDAYTISFEVIGEEPFETDLLGSFDGNVFTSDEIVSGEDYSFFVTDDNDCTSTTVTGRKLCDCDSFSGTMNSELIEVCGTIDSIFADQVMGSFLDPNDIGMYFLHTSSTSSLGMVIDSNFTGGFGYIPEIFLDSIYYISFVVGNDLNDAVDLSDQCLDIAMGQPIRWNSIPNIFLSDDQETCGFNVSLSAVPTNGQWRVVEQPVGAFAMIVDPSDANTDFNFDMTGQYVLEWRTNGVCPNVATTTIIQNPSPVYSNVTTTCAADLMSYTLSFELEDNGAPFTVNGMPTDLIFTSDMLDPTVESTFLITSSASCINQISVGPILCECMSDPGTVNIGEISICTSELLEVNVSNQDFILEEGDTLAYVLHDGDANALGNVLALSYGEPIAFDNTMNTDQIYFLNVIIGENLDGEINFNDPCFEFSEAITIVWLPESIITIPINNSEVCLGEPSLFDVDVMGMYPVELIFENQFGEQSIQIIENDNDQLEFLADAESEIWTLVSVDALCAGPFDEEIIINAQSPWSFTLIDDFEICNNPLFNSTFALEDLFIETAQDGEWNVGQIPLSNDILDFADLPEGVYEIEFSTVGFEPSCPGITQSISILVVLCDCPVFTIADVTVCSDVGSIDLGSFDTQGYAGEWGIIDPNISLIINNSILEIQGNAIGDYLIQYTINDPLYPDVCDTEIVTVITIDYLFSNGVQIDFPTFCDEEISLSLFDLIENEDNGGVWFFDGIMVDSEIDITNLPFGESTFTYEIVSTNSCPSALTEVIIEKNEIPSFTYLAEDVICFGDNNGEIEIIIQDNNGGTYTCFLDDVLQSGDKLISGLEPGSYMVYIEDENGCQSETQEILISEPEIVTVDLGPDQEIELNDEVTIQAIINILESDVSEILWSDLTGVLDVDSLELRKILSEDNTIVIQITDVNGCIAFDEIQITVNVPPVIDTRFYVPNIFNLGDGINGTFRIFNTESIELIKSFRIYDRWGNLVLEKEDLPPDSEEATWDGYYNDVKAEIAVYVYVFDLVFKDGSQEVVAGDLILVR